MKKFFAVILFLGLLTTTSAFAAKKEEPGQISPAAGVLCTKNMKVCSVGKHIMRTNGSNPLYVEDGIVCTPNKKLCTNGFTYMRSNSFI